ncbi:MAG: hypothetical protein QHJ74_16745, partial [Anaerolineae bacterium]|nr:hypothetical protein [Anaerolineae bacterium]
PGAGNPQNLNRYAYVRNNPLRYTDPSGHRVDPFGGVGAREDEPPPLVQARMFYLNEIGNIGGNVFLPNPDPVDRQGYILYRVGQVVGPENVKHIPIFKGDVWNTRLEMFGEMFEKRTWSPLVAEEIAQDIQERPLALGERLIIIGSSGGGTVAIESLDLLEEKGIYVDQVILRGSPVQELILRNVGRVDYITSNFDYYYSFDINPFDRVTVSEYRLDFWGHVPPDAGVNKQIADLIVDLIMH